MATFSRRTFLGLLGLSAATSASSARPLSHRFSFAGITYDTGTDFAPNEISVDWRNEDMEHDLQAIKNDLHCNAIHIFGKDPERLMATAEFASRLGLAAWVQPRLFHAGKNEVKQHVLALATRLEKLRAQYPAVTLNLGCELSLFVNGFIPGADVEARTKALSDRWQELPVYSRALNGYLQEVITEARKRFNGKITYSAGSWENIGWNTMDYISVNYYPDEMNAGEYAAQLRVLGLGGKPLVMSEFGCCCYKGADKAGASGHEIIDWKASGPEIKPGFIRDENVQARYIEKMVRLFEAEQVTGVFPYVFGHPKMLYSKEYRFDLDMASYGIVRYPGNNGKPWEKKAAFHTLARLYRTNQGLR